MSKRNMLFTPSTDNNEGQNPPKPYAFKNLQVVNSARKLIRSATKLKNYDKRMSIMSFDSHKLDVVSDTNSQLSSKDDKKDEENLVAVKKKCHLFMLQNRSKRRIQWDLFIMFLATWN